MATRKSSQFGALFDAMESVKSDSVSNPYNAPEVSLQTVALAALKPGRWQPRQHFDAEALNELAASIKEQGIIQPIVVRTSGTAGEYDIIAGERRWRAAQIAGLREVPVIIRDDWEEGKVALIALLENIQREDLNFIERARGYQKLATEYQLNTEQLAEQLGVSVSHIRRIIALLNLPDDVQRAVESKTLDGTVAMELLPLKDDPARLRKLARQVAENGLSLKQLRAKVASLKAQAPNRKGRPARTSVLQQAKTVLSERLGRGVAVRYNEQTKQGTVVIKFQTLEDLDTLVNVVKGQKED